jgi:hypothetical protein
VIYVGYRRSVISEAPDPGVLGWFNTKGLTSITSLQDFVFPYPKVTTIRNSGQAKSPCLFSLYFSLSAFGYAGFGEISLYFIMADLHSLLSMLWR